MQKLNPLFATVSRGSLVSYTHGQLEKDVSFAYALTVHKAQGSQYPVVILPVIMAHRPLLYRHLLYTAFSRAQRLLIIVGDESALAVAARNNKANERRTLLAERISIGHFAPPTSRHMSPQD